jgi:biotin operon repressor
MNDDLPDSCPTDRDSCPVCSLWQQTGETDAAWHQRLREISDGTVRRQPASPGRPRKPVARLLAVLAIDRWTTGAEVAAQLGIPRSTARTALFRAQRLGAPIESQRRRGYRLQEDVS